MPALAQSSATGSTSTQGASSGSSMSGSGQLSAADRHFVMEAASGGMAEVELGRMATQKAQNADVKSFGQMMVDDHTKANDELKTIASAKGITLPSDLDAKDKATVSRLEKLSGEQFDRAYMQTMTKDHKKDLAEFKKESTAGKDQEIKDWAGKTLPTLEKHLQHAEQTASAVGASGSNASGSSSSSSQKKGTTNSGGK